MDYSKTPQNDSPLVSIVIPAYNSESFIIRALDSTHLTTNPVEVIVVDDGSTDNTASIVKSWAKDKTRLKYIYQENQGPSVARNTAIKAACGEYILFLDADDALEPEAISKFLNIINLEADYSIWIGGYRTHHINGKTKTSRKQFSNNKQSNFKNFVLNKIGGIPHGTAIVRSSVFENLLYPKHLKSQEDVVLFGQILANYKLREKDYVQTDYYLNRLIEEYPDSDEYEEAFFLQGKSQNEAGVYGKSNEIFLKLLKSTVLS